MVIYCKCSIFYTTVQVYWDPSEGKVIKDFVKTTTPIAFMFSNVTCSQMLPFLHVLSIYASDNKFVD